MKKLKHRAAMTLQAVIIALGLTLGITTAAVVFIPDEASAHQYDGYSNIYCEAHKSASHTWVNHSWPYSLQPDLLTYRCTQYDPFIFGHPEHQYFVVRQMSTGAHWRQGGYQWCGSPSYCYTYH